MKYYRITTTDGREFTVRATSDRRAVYRACASYGLTPEIIASVEAQESDGE